MKVKLIKHNKNFTKYFCPICGKKMDCIYHSVPKNYFDIIWFSCHQIWVLPENKCYDPTLKNTNKVRIFRILDENRGAE